MALISPTSDADTEIQCKYSDLMSAETVTPVKPMAAPGLCITSPSAAFILSRLGAPRSAMGKAAGAREEGGTEGECLLCLSGLPLPPRGCVRTHGRRPQFLGDNLSLPTAKRRACQRALSACVAPQLTGRDETFISPVVPT